MAYTVPATNLLNRPILQGLTATSAAAAHDLGYTVKSDDGREFVYCLTNASSVVTYAGYPAYWYPGGTAFHVTSDVDDAMDVDGTDGPIGAAFAGVFTCTVAAAAVYHWVQTAGNAPDASCSTNVTASDNLIAKTDSLFDAYSTAAESSSHVVATALEADTGGFADIMLLGNR